MAKNKLKKIIDRCHRRYEHSHQQRRTIILPATYKLEIPCNLIVTIAHGQSVNLSALEEANISFMPIGRAPANDRGPRLYDSDWYQRFTKQQVIGSWEMRRWRESWGIQVYTGIPSERFGARWHDIVFSYESICIAPDAIYACIDALVEVTLDPLLTLTKSGGLRFSCRIPRYLHPSEDSNDLNSNQIPPNLQSVFPKIIGDKGFSPWDGRYEIVMGDIFDPPIISADILFAPINILREELTEVYLSNEKGNIQISPKVKTSGTPSTALPHTFGSRRLDLARDVFIRRGFSYVRQNNDFHQLTLYPDEDSGKHVLLWERDGIVWVRASSPHNGLPIEATPITEVWEDTGIIPVGPSKSLTLSDDFLDVRHEKISPLSIKRIAPILDDQDHQQLRYHTFRKGANQLSTFVDGGARVFALITEKDVLENSEILSYVEDGKPLCINVRNIPLGEEVEQLFQNVCTSSFSRWKPRDYRWEHVKDLPIDEFLDNPFQHGNVCIAPERCNTLERKGGDPRESICPQCPIYAKCQEHGYLSQYTSFPHLTTQILNNPQIFLNPLYEDEATEILEHIHEDERLCLIYGAETQELFVRCELSVETLKDWIQQWNGEPLGNFANFLLYSLEFHGRFDNRSFKRIRSTLQAFQRQEEVIVKQMSEVNVSCKITEQNYVDEETDQELAQYIIEFAKDVTAYIPLNDNATEVLKAKNIPFFSPESFVLNEDTKVSMPLATAIKLGILNTETVNDIEDFPIVCPKPNWTIWHQLKRFFQYYTRDEDARVVWFGDKLVFRIPPILHPNVKRLMLTTPTLDEELLNRMFPDEVTEVKHAELAAWIKGNKMYQIRTGIYARNSILSYNDSWDVLGLSFLGQRFFVRILEEIQKDPSISHAVVTYTATVKQLTEIIDRENVYLLSFSDDTDRRDAIFEKAQVIWIVGAPEPLQAYIWRQAQGLFGNDDKPLLYEKDIETGLYKDNRLQQIYELSIAMSLKSIINSIRLDQQSAKTVVLVSGIALPGITDQPNTFLFDWEDFEIAGGLEKLPDVIATRQRYETDRKNLNAKSSREEVERVLGCSSRQANRVLQKFRGGAPLRVPFRIQIHELLAEENKKTAELVNSIEGNPEAIKNELKRLVDNGEIIRVQRGLYSSA